MKVAFKCLYFFRLLAYGIANKVRPFPIKPKRLLIALQVPTKRLNVSSMGGKHKVFG